MKRSNRLVILVGVLLAVLAFVGIVVLLNQAGEGGPGEAETTTVNVIVATEDIEIGEAVTPEKAEILAVEADSVEQTRIGDPSLLTGRPAIVPIQNGEQITQEKAGLVSRTTSPEDALEPGEKAIAFQVDRVTGLDFLIQPGDHIDVVVAQEITPLQETQESIDARADDPELQPRYEAITGVSNVRTVKTILQDRRVLYVSGTRVRQVQTQPEEGEEEAPAQAVELENVIIVIAGSAQDAEVIKFAQRDLGEIGALTAILRRIEDTEEGVPPEETTGITLDILVDQYGVPLPGIIFQEPEAQESPAP